MDSNKELRKQLLTYAEQDALREVEWAKRNLGRAQAALTTGEEHLAEVRRRLAELEES